MCQINFPDVTLEGIILETEKHPNFIPFVNSQSSGIERFFLKFDSQNNIDFFQTIIDKEFEPIIMLNDERVEVPEGLKKILKENDVISVLSPISGG